METPDILNSKSVKGFVKGSLVLIGLFAVLYCGVASLVFSFDKNIESSKSIENKKNIYNNNGNNEIDKNNEISKKFIYEKRNVNGKDKDDKVLVLIYFLVFLPIIAFVIVSFKFSCLVKSYYKKLYGSSCDEGVFFKLKKLEIENFEKKKLEIENLEKKKLEIENLEKQNQEKYRHKNQELNMTIEASQILIKTIKSDSKKEEEVLQEIIDMLERFKKMS